MFLGGIEKDHWHEMDYCISYSLLLTYYYYCISTPYQKYDLLRGYSFFQAILSNEIQSS